MMKNGRVCIKRRVALLLSLTMICICAMATACGTYVIIYDSDTRLLYEDEVRGYSLDTLGYVLNEILARHGYHFDPEGIYYEHFMNLNYVYPHDNGFSYQEAPAEKSNEEILADLSDIENANIALIKRIQDEKRAANDYSGLFISWCCEEYPDELKFDRVGYAWREIELPINLKIPVYSGPGEQYLRGAKGRAFVSTNERIYAYGFDGDWVMITYLVNPETGQTRVGYINQNEFGRQLNNERCADPQNRYGLRCYWHDDPFEQMSLSNTSMILQEDTVLTDDPAGAQTPLMQLNAGEKVTILCKLPSDEEISKGKKQWLYVEYEGEKPARGFIPSECMEQNQ